MEPTIINTQLGAKASVELQKEIDEELHLPDPTGEKTMAKLLEELEPDGV